MIQALLVIDAQQELIEGKGEDKAVYKKDSLIENINIVVEKAKEADAFIIFVRDLDVANGEGPGFQVHQGINVPPEAPIFNKKATNSFYDTGLKAFLDDQKVEHLVIMGCQTEYCIDTAVRHATVSSFDVTLVGDGHSTKDTIVLPAEQIIAHHNKTLHGLNNVEHFSVVRYTKDDLFNPIHNNYR